jgi:methionyl-tRNA formyltransferase
LSSFIIKKSLGVILVRSISYNIIFAGTPHFSVSALQALVQSQHKVVAVYTQPDRPSGRGRKLTPSPVKEEALKHHLPVYQPQSLKKPEEQQILADLNADLMVVVAYGLILPKAVLHAPRLGCINIHASLLPRWRGAAPIQRAIEAEDAETGVTIMQMDEGLDTGAMLYKARCAILPQDTSETLYARLAAIGADALLQTLQNLPDLSPVVQDPSLATYAHKITKEEAEIDWTLAAEVIARKVRGFNPWPVSYTFSGEAILRIWQAEVLNHPTIPHSPGKILSSNAEGIVVATGKDVLRIQKLQFPGGRVLSVSDIVNAKHAELAIGKTLGKSRESKSDNSKSHL